MRTLSVLAQNESDGFFYPGYININKPEDATVSVHFYSLKPQEVKQDDVIVVGGSSPCPNLVTGDFVLVQVQYKATWSVLYVPGVVVSPPTERDHATKNFLVVTYTNILVERPRRYVVKIGKEKHDSILERIKELHPRINPMLRSDQNFSGSILRQRRLLKRVTASNCTSLKHRKENWFGTHDKKWKNPFFRKVKARKLLTANLRSSNSSFRATNQRQEKFQRVFRKKDLQDKKEALATDKVADKRLRILQEVIETNKSSNKDKLGPCDTNNDTADRNKYTPTNQEEDLGDIEDELRDIQQSSDERSGSPTYFDSFESINSKDVDSRSSKLSKSEKEEAREASTVVNRYSRNVVREAWTTQNSDRISGNTASSHSSSQSSTNRSGNKSKNSSTSRHTLKKKHRINRRNQSSDDFSDDTSSTDNTITNDVLGQGQEVLTRWSDDGWYYFGVIVTEIGEDKYVVRDVTGYKETIDKTNILTDSEQRFQVLQPGDPVIALHPNYVFSYAPGRIRDVYPSSSVTVEFYDMASTKLPATEVYKISLDKFFKDVTYIKHCEQKLCLAQNVIARDDKTGLYIQCKVECPTNHNQTFFVRLPDMTFVKQSAIHIFPIKSRHQRQEQVLEYTLAPVETGSSVFLPACVIQWRPFCVRFCGGSISRNLQPIQCFYINKDYYNNAVNYFHHAQANGRIYDAEEARYESRMSPWPGSNSDLRSSKLSHHSYGNGRQTDSSSNSYDGSCVLNKKRSIERNLMYNPNVIGYQRKPKHRNISIQHIPE